MASKKKSKRAKVCSSSRGTKKVRVHVRSCPKSRTFPRVSGYKPSLDKCVNLAARNIFPVECKRVLQSNLWKSKSKKYKKSKKSKK